MQPKNSTTGKAPTVFHLTSASAVNPSSFVLREMRQLRELGWDMVIGQLRPFFGNMSTMGFDELSAIVVKPRWLTLQFLAGIAYYSASQPWRFWQYIALILRTRAQLSELLKMLYILMGSAVLAYRCRTLQSVHVRAHFLHSEALAAYFVSGFLQAPYSITVHTVVTHFPSKVVREVIEKASFIVADTNQVREFLHRQGAPRERIRIIRNGLPLEEFLFRTDRSLSDPPVVLAAGYLTPKKGFDVLLVACELLFQRGVRFRCVLVGDGKERGRLTKLRDELGLQKVVEMLGNLRFDELREWYYRATLFLMPSVTLADGSTDGLPTVVIESLACGTPVIGTDTGAIPEVILDGRTGCLVPAGSPDAIADRVQMLLSQQALRGSLALEGRRLVEQEFDLRRNCETLAALVLSNGNAPQTFVNPIAQNPEH
jgi:colanic acid/amylovoran biosynthesis glycosyltransferase